MNVSIIFDRANRESAAPTPSAEWIGATALISAYCWRSSDFVHFVPKPERFWAITIALKPVYGLRALVAI